MRRHLFRAVTFAVALATGIGPFSAAYSLTKGTLKGALIDYISINMSEKDRSKLYQEIVSNEDSMFHAAPQQPIAPIENRTT